MSALDLLKTKSTFNFTQLNTPEQYDYCLTSCKLLDLLQLQRSNTKESKMHIFTIGEYNSKELGVKHPDTFVGFEHASNHLKVDVRSTDEFEASTMLTLLKVLYNNSWNSVKPFYKGIIKKCKACPDDSLKWIATLAQVLGEDIDRVILHPEEDKIDNTFFLDGVEHIVYATADDMTLLTLEDLQHYFNTLKSNYESMCVTTNI